MNLMDYLEKSILPALFNSLLVNKFSLDKPSFLLEYSSLILPQ